ncbi:hypothetical protein JCM30760_10160 [Thiomicrorhabdus hydrogeniphila]
MLPTGVSVGCPFLAQRIDELEIKAHLFGHIHDAYGLSHEANYVAANSAIMNEEYKPVNQPQIIDLNRH